MIFPRRPADGTARDEGRTRKCRSTEAKRSLLITPELLAQGPVEQEEVLASPPRSPESHGPSYQPEGYSPPPLVEQDVAPAPEEQDGGPGEASAATQGGGGLGDMMPWRSQSQGALAVACLVTTCVLIWSAMIMGQLLRLADAEDQGYRFRLTNSVIFAVCASLVVTAVTLSLRGHVAVCIDIANMAAIQMSMVAMPLLVFMGLFLSDEENEAFALVFSSLSFTGVICSTIVLNYITLSGRTDTLAGVVMAMIFFLWLAMYAHVPLNEEYLLPSKSTAELLKEVARDVNPNPGR